MELNKATFSEKPNLVEAEDLQVRINFDIEEQTIDVPTNDEEGEATEKQTVFMAYAVRVDHPVTRDRVVDAIITAAYPNDVMQALINNHLLEADSAEHEAEFKAMQEWRAHAKEIATEVVQTMR